jgi:hypothetical protein
LTVDAARHKRDIDLMSPVLEQAALVELITSGSYERHIRRSRVAYRRRSDLVVELITRDLPDAEVVESSAGLHLLVNTPSVPEEATVEREAARCGAQVIGLGRHRHAPAPLPSSPVLSEAGGLGSLVVSVWLSAPCQLDGLGGVAAGATWACWISDGDTRLDRWFVRWMTARTLNRQASRRQRC